MLNNTLFLTLIHSLFLKTHQVVKYPIKNGLLQTNVNSTFIAHSNRKHIGHLLEDFKTTILTSGIVDVFWTQLMKNKDMLHLILALMHLLMRLLYL